MDTSVRRLGEKLAVRLNKLLPAKLLVRKTRAAWDLSRLIFSGGHEQPTHLCRLVHSVSFAGIPTIPLAELVSQLETIAGAKVDRVVMHPRLRGGGSGSVAEMAVLSTLTASRRPRTILEFGTYDGCSTWHLWANSSDESSIITLDLPSGVQVAGSSDLGLQGIARRDFLPDSSQIELLEIDSRHWTPKVPGGVDLCFIDAGHTYGCAKNDTEKALAVMNPGGLIVWHDAAWRCDDYGVNRYLKDLRASGRDVRMVEAGPFDYCALAALVV